MATEPDARFEQPTFGSPLLTRIGDFWVARHASRQTRHTSTGAYPAIVVVGGTRGIGRAFVMRALGDGHHVVAVARSLAPLSAWRTEQQQAVQQRLHLIAQDMVGPDAPQRLLAQIREAGLAADVVIMCAGIGLSGPYVSADPAQNDDLVAVNVAAVARLARAVLAQRVEAGRGGLILLSSLGAAAPGPNQALYYASKAFVTSLAEALAHEVSATGVRVCCIMPGPVNTTFHRDMNADHAPYRHLLFQLSPQTVVAASMRGYALGLRVVVPGPLNKLMYVALKVLPRRLSGLIVGKLLGWKAPRS